MEVASFIKACARTMADEQRVVISAEEWLDILNFQGAEMSPEVGCRHVSEVDWTGKYQISLDTENFKGVENILEVFLQDEGDQLYKYDNWVYHRDLKMLDLSPSTSGSSVDPASYKKIKIVWWSPLPTFKSYRDELNLSPIQLPLLLKVCVREALRRILNDHAKLDRYRTLVGRMSEYSLMAMIRDLTTEIEMAKRKYRNTLPLETF